jgi:FkbM family methyltransferase
MQHWLQFDRLKQLRRAHPRLWFPFLRGWLKRRRTGFVPCVMPGCRNLLNVPANDFYESYSFFCEGAPGRGELGYFLERVAAGDVLYDIGAFRGVFSAASKLKWPTEVAVHAFEPIPQSVEAMKRIRALNHFSSFEIVPQAVGDGCLETAGVKTQDGMLHAGESSGPGEALRIRTLALDQYVADGHPAATIMKIDVEGYELQVLKGARHCLNTCKPRLWLEVHPGFLQAQGKSPEEVLSLLREAGYSISFFEDYNAPTSNISYHVWCV